MVTVVRDVLLTVMENAGKRDAGVFFTLHPDRSRSLLLDKSDQPPGQASANVGGGNIDGNKKSSETGKSCTMTEATVPGDEDAGAASSKEGGTATAVTVSAATQKRSNDGSNEDASEDGGTAAKRKKQRKDDDSVKGKGGGSMPNSAVNSPKKQEDCGDTTGKDQEEEEEKKVPPLKIILSGNNGSPPGGGGEQKMTEKDQVEEEKASDASASRVPVKDEKRAEDNFAMTKDTTSEADAAPSAVPISGVASRMTRSRANNQGGGAVPGGPMPGDQGQGGGASGTDSSTSTHLEVVAASVASADTTGKEEKSGNTSYTEYHVKKRKLRTQVEESNQAGGGNGINSVPIGCGTGVVGNGMRAGVVGSNGVILNSNEPLNDIQKYLNIRKQVEQRRKNLFPVHPKPPQGYRDYLMNRKTYLLEGNANERLRSMPMIQPPPSLEGPMRELFIEQEKARYGLRKRHLVEKEKLVLTVEQEIIRVHGRAARALANQPFPYSVCTILRDEEIYTPIDSQQEEKNRDIRSRYNGRLFLSWLQDVDDKWEKIKVERAVFTS